MRCAELRAHRRACRLQRLELVEPTGRLVAVCQHLLDGVAVLAAELDERVPALAHCSEALLVGLDALGQRSEVGGAVTELRGEPGQTVRHRSEGRTMLQSICRHRQAIAGAALADDRVERCGRGLAMPDGVSEQALLGLEATVLSLDGGDPIDLLDLMAQQVDLPRSSPLVAAEVVEALGQLTDRPAGAEQLLAVDPTVAIQRAALGARPEQCLLRMLTVHLHEGLAELGESAGGGERAVDRGAGATGRGHRAAEHPLGVADGEESLDDDLVGSRPHPGRVGTSPPRSRSASTIMVLPAPVSPVTATSPAPTATRASGITPRLRTDSSTSIDGQARGSPGRTR